MSVTPCIICSWFPLIHYTMPHAHLHRDILILAMQMQTLHDAAKSYMHLYAFSGSIALQAQGLKPRERLFQENSVHRGVKVQRWVKPYEAGRRENTWTQWTLLYICSLVYIVYICLHFLHFHTCQHLVNWSHLSFWTCFVASNELSSGRVWWDALRRSWLTCTSHY